MVSTITYSFGEHSTWDVLGSRGSIEVAFGTTSKDTPYEGTDSTVPNSDTDLGSLLESHHFCILEVDHNHDHHLAMMLRLYLVRFQTQLFYV